MKDKYCYYSKANYCENYHLMTGVLQNLKDSRRMVLASHSASQTRGLARISELDLSGVLVLFYMLQRLRVFSEVAMEGCSVNLKNQ